MQRTDPPRAFGVFKPVGHTVIAFDDEQSADHCAEQLSDSGETDITRYTPQQMLAQTADDLQDAGTLAAIGQELNLVKAHREMAQQGAHFLVVKTSSDEHASQIAEIASQAGAKLAQHYGKFMVEELIDSADNQEQVFESADRGLDKRD